MKASSWCLMSTNGFVRKKVETLALGERLKKMRADRCMTIADVSRAIGIQMRYINALEEGKYDMLPADVYVRGFLKSYAHYFGASPDPFVLLYERERGIEQTLRSQSSNPLKGLEGRARLPIFVITPKILTMVIAVLICLGSAGYVYVKFRDFVSEPRLTIMDPVNGSRVSESSVLVRGISERDSRVFINGEPVLVDENGNFSEFVSLHLGANDITVSASNRFSKKTVQKIVVEALTKLERSEDLEHRVLIRVEQEPVFVQVKNESGEAWSGILSPGYPQEIFLKGNPIFSAGKGRLVYVTINGRGEEQLSDASGPVENVIIEQ